MHDAARTSRTLFLFEVAVYALLSIGWIAFIHSGTENGIGYFHQPRQDLLWPLIHGAFFNGVTFFANAFWLIPRYLKRPRYGSYVLGLSGLFVGVIGCKTLLDQLIIRLDMPELAGLSFTALALENVYIFPGFVFLSFVYRFGRDWITHQREKRMLIEARREAELAALRAQIGPHFLFNTLNNLYSLGLRGETERVTRGIAKLSQLLRFILHDSGKARVPLASEIGYIESFLELSRLAVAEEDLTLEVDLDGTGKELQLAPLLLFPFVENAFKHGIGANGGSHIRIALATDGNRLDFNVVNSLAPHKADAGTKMSGLGLDNVRQRLALLYPDTHELSVTETDDEFRVRLRLELPRDD